MTLNDPQFDIPPIPPGYNYAMDKLHQLQAEFVVTARMWAIDEIGAAVAHQLNDPLTALFIYLHEIEQIGEQSSPHANALPLPVREIVEKAAHEAKRACDILERLRQGVETPVDTQSAVARARDAINALTLSGRPHGSAVRQPPPSSGELHPLTPREREVLAQVTAGASNKEGSHRLGISKRTFEAHRAHLMRKVGARNAADLVRTALSGQR